MNWNIVEGKWNEMKGLLRSSPVGSSAFVLTFPYRFRGVFRTPTF
jgi:hypothetical protein